MRIQANQDTTMQKLHERLSRIKERFESNLAPGYLKILNDATSELVKSGIENKVLKVGDTAPAFRLQDQNGKLRDSADLLSSGPLVLTFYRGFWCPICNADLGYLQHLVKEIEEASATLIAISPEKNEYSKKIRSTQKLSFDLLWDERNAIAEKFGLKHVLRNDVIDVYRDGLNFNLKLYHGDEEWALPIPARFLIDTDGIIRYAESSADHTKRPEPDDLVNALRTITT